MRGLEARPPQSGASPSPARWRLFLPRPLARMGRTAGWISPGRRRSSRRTEPTREPRGAKEGWCRRRRRASRSPLRPFEGREAGSRLEAERGCRGVR